MDTFYMAYLYLLIMVWVVLQVSWLANPSASWLSSCGQWRLLSFACYYCLSYVSIVMCLTFLNPFMWYDALHGWCVAYVGAVSVRTTGCNTQR
jgi:hypothetical protein